MGMYTELYLSCGFKKDTPNNIITLLEFWFGKLQPKPHDETLPDHPLFECDRWTMIGKCSSHYFTPISTSNLFYDTIGHKFYLTTRFDLKNYCGEIDHFLDFIMPYIDNYEGDHLGHKRYEEDDEPTIIYMVGGHDR